MAIEIKDGRTGEVRRPVEIKTPEGYREAVRQLCEVLGYDFNEVSEINVTPAEVSVTRLSEDMVKETRTYFYLV